MSTALLRRLLVAVVLLFSLRPALAGDWCPNCNTTEHPVIMIDDSGEGTFCEECAPKCVQCKGPLPFDEARRELAGVYRHYTVVKSYGRLGGLPAKDGNGRLCAACFNKPHAAAAEAVERRGKTKAWALMAVGIVAVLALSAVGLRVSKTRDRAAASRNVPYALGAVFILSGLVFYKKPSLIVDPAAMDNPALVGFMAAGLVVAGLAVIVVRRFVWVDD